MKEKLSYDEALKRIEAIVTQLETADAISLEEYKRLSSEATQLLNQCKAEIESMAKEILPSQA